MKNSVISLSFIIAIGFIFLSATIDLDQLFNYANQEIPEYITKDNTGDNVIDDKVATLGRVLFYDKNLSKNQTIACASCHVQSHAFGDPNIQSTGVNGFTPRHSMRLVNARFSNEDSFFWDERAETLEMQTTQPIKDHIEMGFSGTHGDPTFEELLLHLESLDYYHTLFEFAYGDSQITENRMQLALAQFIRSIQSFDSKFDEGLMQVNFANEPFPNYTPQENRGKNLYLNIGCADCHMLSEFALHFNSLNNGVITVAGIPGAIDITNIRAPSLRNLAKPDGTLNGPFMHDGSFSTLLAVVNHYNAIPNHPENTNLDTRLKGPNGEPQQLNLTENDKQDLVAFLKTLAGVDVYTNEKWSNPFEPDGSIKIIGGNLSVSQLNPSTSFTLYPNPTYGVTILETNLKNFNINIYSQTGKLLHSKEGYPITKLDLSALASGMYFLQITTEQGIQYTNQLVKK
ncbi:MAG: cytochrome c peroxidase [Flavobacteriaceae bacterium]